MDTTDDSLRLEENGLGGGGHANVAHEAHPAGHEEEHGEGGHGEPWLVSYADMMTLLFGFFVLMYSFASANPQQREEMRKRIAESMGSEYTSPFVDVIGEIKMTIEDAQLVKEVEVQDTFEGIRIISKGTLFFDSGSVTLKPQAEELLVKIAGVIVKRLKDFRVIVEGHTDDVPIATREIPSNWELSALRAGTVVRLWEAHGVARAQLRPMGLADIEPVAPNRDAQGVPIERNMAENRRIVIRIQKAPSGLLAPENERLPLPTATAAPALETAPAPTEASPAVEAHE